MERLYPYMFKKYEDPDMMIFWVTEQFEPCKNSCRVHALFSSTCTINQIKNAWQIVSKDREGTKYYNMQIHTYDPKQHAKFHIATYLEASDADYDLFF